MAKPTIYVAAGHGGSDPGACAGGYIEKALTLKTALACRDYLKAYDCDVIMARTADVDCKVADKMAAIEAKKSIIDLVLEMHYNAGGGEGCEVYYWHTHASSKALAQKVLTEMTKLGQKSRGIKESKAGTSYNFGMCRQAATTGIPSILGEYAFVDNAKDQAKINSDAKLRAVGEAYAKAAVSYLGLRKRSTAGDAPSTKPEAIGVGDIVQFAGGKVYASSTATAAASTRGASKCKVTATAPGAKHPFHCISEDGKGVYGWVDAAAVGAPTAAKPVEVGCTVTINKGAVYGGLTSARGNKVPAAQLAPKKHTVSKIQVNKDVQEALLKEIMSWVAVSFLTRV